MKPPRSSEDRFLALLARHPLPLEHRDFAQELGCSRQRAMEVLARLLKGGRVVTVRNLDPRPGRPPTLYSLPGWVWPDPNLWRPLRAIPPDAVVLTPSGRDARVERVSPAGFAVLVYLDDPHGAPVQLHIALLRVLQAGRERPAPVRLIIPVTA